MANPLHFPSLFRILYDIIDQKHPQQDQWREHAALKAFVVLDVWGGEKNQATAALHLRNPSVGLKEIHTMCDALSTRATADYDTVVRGRQMFGSKRTNESDVWDVLYVAATKYDQHKHGHAMYTLIHVLPPVLQYVAPQAMRSLLLTVKTYCYSVPFQSVQEIETGYQKQISGAHDNPIRTLQNYARYLHTILIPPTKNMNSEFGWRINAGIANHILKNLRGGTSKYVSMTLSELKRFTGNFSSDELRNYIKKHCVGQQELGLTGLYQSTASVTSNFMIVQPTHSMSAAINSAIRPTQQGFQLFGDSRNISALIFVAHTHLRTGNLTMLDQILTHDKFTEHFDRWQSL